MDCPAKAKDNLKRSGKMDLTDFSEEELLEALNKVRERKNQRPKVRDKSLIISDLDRLIVYTERHIDEKLKLEDRDDTEHYIYENVMEIIYGTNFWNWWNSL